MRFQRWHICDPCGYAIGDREWQALKFTPRCPRCNKSYRRIVQVGHAPDRRNLRPQSAAVTAVIRALANKDTAP